MPTRELFVEDRALNFSAEIQEFNLDGQLNGRSNFLSLVDLIIGKSEYPAKIN